MARWPRKRPRYADLTPAQLAKNIAALEKQMFQHAQNLEFEEAASVRDQIAQLKEAALRTPAV